MAQSTLAQPNVARRARASGFKFKPQRFWLYVIVIVLCIIFGFPLFWTLMSSLKTPSDIVKFPPVWIPPVFQWQNYVKIFGISRIPVTVWAWNSLLIVVLGTVGTV